MDPLRGFVLAKDPTSVFLVPRCAAGLFAFTDSNAPVWSLAAKALLSP